MTENLERSPLDLPALRGRIGDWVYYIALMTFRDVADRVSFADQIHEAKSLKELLQRTITGNRSKEIKDYLINQPERFFNALVVGTFGGSPNWYELDVETEGTELDPSAMRLEGTLGVLRLDGTELLWAIDGQHRVAGIKAALEDNQELGDEEISVIFVKGITSSHRQEDPNGFTRTRRLFTTLNRYAKPVSKRDIIALDEDDVVAILTRRSIEQHPLFSDGKISLGKARSIRPGDSQSLTTIEVLYDVIDIYLRDTNHSNWKKYKTTRPSDSDIIGYYDHAIEFWAQLIHNFLPLREFEISTSEQEVAGKYRHKAGGHLLFRPVGMLITARVIKDLIEHGENIKSASNAISQVPMEISESPWGDLLWDTVNNRMITAPENQKIARRLFAYGAGASLSIYNTDLKELKTEYAGIIKKEYKELELLRYI